MGEDITIKEQSTAGRLREQIRHTESDISETVRDLEQRLSPRYLRQRGVRKAKKLAWQGTAQFFDLAQRTSVQASLAGASALWVLVRSLTGRKAAARKHVVQPVRRAGAANKAAGTSALRILQRRSKAGMEGPAKNSARAGVALSATAAKAFLSSLRAAKKSATTRPGRKVAWCGLATAIGAALGSYWYSQKEHRA